MDAPSSRTRSANASRVRRPRHARGLRRCAVGDAANAEPVRRITQRRHERAYIMRAAARTASDGASSGASRVSGVGSSMFHSRLEQGTPEYGLLFQVPRAAFGIPHMEFIFPRKRQSRFFMRSPPYDRRRAVPVTASSARIRCRPMPRLSRASWPAQEARPPDLPCRPCAPSSVQRCRPSRSVPS
jgi:hypothetical protein